MNGNGKMNWRAVTAAFAAIGIYAMYGGGAANGGDGFWLYGHASSDKAPARIASGSGNYWPSASAVSLLSSIEGALA